jgi:teichuronic acid biosynthesis glycosyltransferase TuaH
MQLYFSCHGAAMEPQLAAKYDVVVANSEYLANYLKAYNKHTYMVGQGCDLKNFDYSMAYIPEELERIRNPIIGYVGFLTSLRLDIELISNIARNRPDYSIVLVGPEDEDFMQSKLHQIENVFFLGSKNEVELSSYINGFDVAINPQLVNMMTIGNYPRKIDEYLAMGKPIVATDTMAMAYFKENVYLSRNEDEFLTNIDLAIKENNDELIKQRVDCAMSHGWENNVEQIYNVINKL